MAHNTVKPVLMMECKLCDYRPPETSTMGEFEMHFRLEHEGADVAMRLSAVCPDHATTMEHIESKPTGGGFKDWFRCPTADCTGFIKRNGE